MGVEPKHYWDQCFESASVHYHISNIFKYHIFAIFYLDCPPWEHKLPCWSCFGSGAKRSPKYCQADQYFLQTQQVPWMQSQVNLITTVIRTLFEANVLMFHVGNSVPNSSRLQGWSWSLSLLRTIWRSARIHNEVLVISWNNLPSQKTD